MSIDKKIAQLQAYQFVIDEINAKISALESYLSELTENETNPINPQYEKYRPTWINETQVEIDALKSIIPPIEFLATH